MLQLATKPRIREALNSPVAVEAYTNGSITAAQEVFEAYRRFMNPRFTWFSAPGQFAWFPLKLARELRQFYDDFVAGKRPILILTTPPQHGKSLAVIDFISWVVGH